MKLKTLFYTPVLPLFPNFTIRQPPAHSLFSLPLLVFPITTHFSLCSCLPNSRNLLLNLQLTPFLFSSFPSYPPPVTPLPSCPAHSSSSTPFLFTAFPSCPPPAHTSSQLASSELTPFLFQSSSSTLSSPLPRPILRLQSSSSMPSSMAALTIRFFSFPLFLCC